MKRLLGVIFSLCLGLVAITTTAQAAGTDLQDIIARGEIVVGVDMTTPPWGYLNDKQKPDGYGVALGQVLADSHKVKLKVEPITGPTRIPSLLDGRTDVIISTLSITAPPRRPGLVHQSLLGQFPGTGWTQGDKNQQV
jgi:polar amino acid transport system substrate-binding protein